MNTPITASYFRKLALYQEAIALNKVFRKAVCDLDGGSKDTWEIEKKALYWTRWGHKHLGSAITVEEFKDNASKRLKEFGLTEEEVQDKSGGGQYWSRNLAERGFADLEGRGIRMSERGRLMGAVLYDVYRLKCIDDQRLWHKKFWRSYGKKYGATHFLAKRYLYWVYRLFIVFGWTLFLVAAVLVFWALVDRINGT
jgi:hypothetical protein